MRGWSVSWPVSSVSSPAAGQLRSAQVSSSVTWSSLRHETTCWWWYKLHECLLSCFNWICWVWGAQCQCVSVYLSVSETPVRHIVSGVTAQYCHIPLLSIILSLLHPAPACSKLWHSKKLTDTSFKANKKFHHQVFPGVGWCKYKNVFSGLVTEGGDDIVDMVGDQCPRRQQHWQTPACERGQQSSVRCWMLLLTASGDNKQLEHLISRSARYDQHQYDGIIQQWMVFCVDVEHCW